MRYRDTVWLLSCAKRSLPVTLSRLAFCGLPIASGGPPSHLLLAYSPTDSVAIALSPITFFAEKKQLFTSTTVPYSKSFRL